MKVERVLSLDVYLEEQAGDWPLRLTDERC